ncbi:glycosyltransferase family 2 protein [Sphingomonas sp. TDK1]|uniref:glycosyltransferase family 2 protein n=1 Tax=Sphingomonas sp. TDK1 TaxID=453247 RepID=UPI0007D8E2D4|nr:glycosyltransferase family 2 protein [Sphingomonas sp. TDK1]OAN66843.1 glycosyl transferase [Sphingomonas sp. TDK1]
MSVCPDPEVSVLVVAYQSVPFLAECFSSIAAAARGTRFEILLIDNGDGSSEAFTRAQFPDVRIVASEGNIGFGAGNNRLARHARAPRLLLVNPDAAPMPGSIDRLVAFSKQRPEAAAWGGRSYSPKGDLDPANFMALPTPGDFVVSIVDSSPLRRGGLAPNAVEPGPVDVLNGGFMMVRTDVWRAIGGFDEGFFLYAEEIDLFERIRSRGDIVLVDPGVGVVHNTGSGQSMSGSRLIYLTTGRMHYARKHFSPLGAWITGCALWLTAAKYAAIAPLLARLKPHDADRLRQLAKGWRAVLNERPRWWYGYRRTGDPR